MDLEEIQKKMIKTARKKKLWMRIALGAGVVGLLAVLGEILLIVLGIVPILLFEPLAIIIVACMIILCIGIHPLAEKIMKFGRKRFDQLSDEHLQLIHDEHEEIMSRMQQDHESRMAFLHKKHARAMQEIRKKQQKYKKE